MKDKPRIIMKTFLLTFLALLISPHVFAQNQPPQAYKVGEHERIGAGCEEYGRMANLFEGLRQNPGSRGLIVVYSGDNKKRFGNVEAYVEGVKLYFKQKRLPPEKITLVIAEGKNLFNEEFWIVPENAEFPDIKPFGFDWSRLDAKYLFSETCLRCEPSYPELTDFQSGIDVYAEILKTYPNYHGLIEVNDYSELSQIRNSLIKNFKVPRRRFTITLAKKNPENSLSVNLYIVPQTKDSKRGAAKLSARKTGN